LEGREASFGGQGGFFRRAGRLQKRLFHFRRTAFKFKSLVFLPFPWERGWGKGFSSTFAEQPSYCINVKRLKPFKPFELYSTLNVFNLLIVVLIPLSGGGGA